MLDGKLKVGRLELSADWAAVIVAITTLLLSLLFSLASFVQSWVALSKADSAIEVQKASELDRILHEIETETTQSLDTLEAIERPTDCKAAMRALYAAQEASEPVARRNYEVLKRFGGENILDRLDREFAEQHAVIRNTASTDQDCAKSFETFLLEAKNQLLQARDAVRIERGRARGLMVYRQWGDRD